MGPERAVDGCRNSVLVIHYLALQDEYLSLFGSRYLVTPWMRVHHIPTLVSPARVAGWWQCGARHRT